MNFLEFADVAVGGVPLLFVVIGLVEYAKRFGLKGDALLGVSMVLGLIFGVGYQISQLGVPVAFDGWFFVVVFGLGLGLIASGIYDAGKDMLGRS